MKKMLLQAAAWLLFATLNVHFVTVHAQGTAFTYQGRLNAGGALANGLYDYRFKLYVDELGNTQVGSSYLTNAIAVTNGLFVTTIDFGTGIFNGSNYWLEVDVKTNLGGSYTVLGPLQAVTPTPYAIFATTASNVSGTVSAGQISGMVANGNLPSSPTVTGTLSAGSFAGNGANVTNVNAAALNGLTSASFWQTNGNTGANPTNGAFLGTTDLEPLELHVNGQRAFRLEPGSSGTGAQNVIGGSPANFVTAGIYGATIGGGGGTNIDYGYSSNSVTANFGTVSGGVDNTAGALATVSGGYGNTASGEGATVGGGQSDTANNNYATIGGGYRNSATGFGATVAGGGWDGDVSAGVGNSAGGEDSSVGGGNVNTASGDYSAVGGGYRNRATTTFATVPGGLFNVASGEYSFAAGNTAQALHQGAFVWADSEGTPFASTTNDQFLIRAQGGVGIGATNPIGGAALTIRYPQGAPTNSMPSQDNGLGIGQYSTSGYKWLQSYGGPLTLNPLGNNVGINTTNPAHLFQVGNAYCDGNQWYPSSDRNVKSGFETISPQAVLAKVAALPITRWHYTNDVATAHLGPMAQDFYAAFRVGPDDRHISTLDEGSVALAAIQGLNQKLEQKDAEITELKARLDKLEQLMAGKPGDVK